MSEPCEACRAYRAGERENDRFLGMVVHVCEREPDRRLLVGLMTDRCDCGCEMRAPGLIEKDKWVYGNCFLNERGGRIDPRTVRAV